ncbi:MAG: hypothetical protein IJW78_04555 [Clostridia bacterium]|nr:hypothetical protein [Clostridia bacterium]
MEIPVYLFVGFLEAGKTKFIQETLEDVRFNSTERTLLLLCEEGEQEYEPAKFSGKDVFIETVESTDALNATLLNEFLVKHRAERVMIEYNGMWPIKNLIDALPEKWVIYQQMLFVETETFMGYNTNMRSLVYDKLSTSQVVVFNRVPEGFDTLALHKIVRAANRNAEIAYEYCDGRVDYDDIEDPLPFDVDADIIVIKDTDFGLWFRDLMETPQKYQNKMVKFKGIIAVDPKMPKDTIVIGRHIMTCCADDIDYGGLICETTEANNWATRDWAVLTATVKIKRHKGYRGIGPVLEASSLSRTTPPEQQVVTF